MFASVSASIAHNQFACFQHDNGTSRFQLVETVCRCCGGFGGIDGDSLLKHRKLADENVVEG